MTTLPSLPTIDDLFKPDPLDLVPEQPVRPPRKVREVATDTLIKSNRAATPTSVADQRANKRMSIGELNSLDLPTLMERYQATPYDDRGPVTRFLDLLDLPRNIIAGTAFPSIRRRKEAEGDVGTAGLGNVRFSDILDEMGVAPGIIRGVAGFIGDVAMDPLTYVGPAGWGAKLVGTGGKAIEVTAAGRRALESGIRSAARGAPVADEAVASVLRAAGYGAEQIATKRGAKNAKDFAGEIRNAVLGQSSDGKFGTAMSWLGGDVGTKGSVLADAFHSPIKSEMSEAARAFVAKHGTAAAPGIGLGVGPVGAKSAIAHIPFTSYGLFVPAFTGAAKEAGIVAARATAGFSAATGAIGEDVNFLGDLHKEMRSINEDLRGLLDELHNGDEDAMSAAQIQDSIDQLNDRRKALLDRADKAIHSTDPEGMTGGLYEGLGPSRPQNRLESIADVVHQEGQYRNLIDESLDFENQTRDTVETVRKRREVMNAIAPEVNARTEELVNAARAQHEAQYGEGGLLSTIHPPLAENVLFHGTRSNNIASFIDDKGNLVLRPSENFNGSQVGVSFSPNKETAWDYATRRPGEGPVRSKAQATVFEIDQNALNAANLRQEAPDEIMHAGSGEVVIPKGQYRIHQDEESIGALAEWEQKQVDRVQSMSDAKLVAKHVRRGELSEIAEFGNEIPPDPADSVTADIFAKHGHTDPDNFPVWQEMVNRVHRSKDPARRAAELAAAVPDTAQFTSPERLAQELLAAKPGPHNVSKLSATPIKVPEFDTRAARMVARKTALAEAMPNLKAGQRALLNIDPTEADIMEGIADSIQAEMKIRASQASAIKGTIQETALNTKNKMLADVAADMAGLGPTTGGYSAFTPLREATRAIFGDDHTVTQFANKKFDALDEWTRKMFGLTQGEAGRARRQFQATRDVRGQEAMARKFNEITNAAKDILAKHKIDPANWEQANELMLALAYAERMKAGENWSVHGSPILKMLEDAKSGPLAAAQHDLRELAARNIHLLDSMTQQEMMLKILGDNLQADYLMGGATREGAQALQDLSNTVEGATAKASSRVTEPFQREKSMTRAIWKGPMGDTNAMYRFEYDFFRSFLDDAGNLTDVGRERLKTMQAAHPDIAGINEGFWQAVKAGDPAAQEMIGRLTPWEKMAYLAGSYDKLPGSYRVGEGSFKQVDAFLLNQEFPNRLGVMMPGKNIPRGMFETSFAELMAKRTAAHERANLAAQFNEILSQHASAIGAQVERQAILSLKQGVDSAEIKFANGSTGRIEKAANGEYIVRVGDQKYRKLRGMSDVQAGLNELGGGVYDSASLVKYFPEKVAEAYERVAEVINSKQSQYIGMYDDFLKVWKSATLFHPSWIIGDVAGGLIQALAAGVNPAKFGASLPAAMKLAMISDKPELLKAFKITIGGKEMTGEEAMKLLNRLSVPSGHAHGEVVAKLIDGGVYLPEYTNTLMSKATLKDPVGAFTTRFREMRSRAAEKARITADALKLTGPTGEKVKKGLSAYNFLLPELAVRNLFSPFMALNGRANDALRIATFMSLMEDGHDAAGAASKVLEAMFDVSDLTKFETDYMKRIIPFYSWMKHSGVYWTRRLMQNPALANMAPRVKRAIEEGLYGDDSVPDHLRPNWMRDQLALQIGADPTKRYALTLGTAIPQETAYAVGAAAASPITGAMGLKQMLEQVGFGLALPLKAAFELASGREAFSGRSISFSPNEGDLSVGEYLAGQVRPLRELGVGNIRQGPIQKAIESGPLTGASRLLLGGRSQPFDDDRIRQNIVKQFKDSEQQVRKRITIAEREKNQRASLDARATLMRLYDTMVQRGLDEEVPAWARLQLEELHAGR